MLARGGESARHTYDDFTAVCMLCLFVGWVICDGEHEADARGVLRAWCRWCHLPFRCDALGKPVLLS